MNRKIKEIEYKIKSEIRAEFFPDTVEELHQYKDEKKIFVFLCGFYQNMGDMAITYSQEYFLKTIFPGYKVILVPSNKTYHWMKEIKRITNRDDIITILGGGNMSEIYESLENARRFVIRKFPDNQIISFPQTIDFSDTFYGNYRLRKTVRTYNKSKNLKIFARERKSFGTMRQCFNKEIGFCPDIVLYLDKSEPRCERSGVLCCMRSDKEMLLSAAESTRIKDALTERYSDIVFKDTVDVTLEECSSDNFRTTLESFWATLRSKKVVVTDRLHCMIFCAITGTPCIVFDNSNNKISGVYDEWLSGCDFIKMCKKIDIEDLLSDVDEMMKLDSSNFKNPCSRENFVPLVESIKQK